MRDHAGDEMLGPAVLLCFAVASVALAVLIVGGVS